MENVLDEFYDACIDNKDLVAFTWRGKLLSEMEIGHIKNCINFLKRKDHDYEFEIAALEEELTLRNETRNLYNI
jgi:hypothetical protein